MNMSIENIVCEKKKKKKKKKKKVFEQLTLAVACCAHCRPTDWEVFISALVFFLNEAPFSTSNTVFHKQQNNKFSLHSYGTKL